MTIQMKALSFFSFLFRDNRGGFLPVEKQVHIHIMTEGLCFLDPTMLTIIFRRPILWNCNFDLCLCNGGDQFKLVRLCGTAHPIPSVRGPLQVQIVLEGQCILAHYDFGGSGPWYCCRDGSVFGLVLV